MRTSIRFLLGVLLLFSCPAFRPVAAECIDYAQYLHWRSVLSFSTWCMDVATAGSWAVVVFNHEWIDGGLKIIDVTDPDNLTIVGSLDLPAPASDVALAGRYACVMGEETFWVVDLADVRNPVLCGTYALVQAQCIAASGTYAYVGTSGCLLVIDVADPGCPHVVGELDTFWGIDGMHLYGTTLYAGGYLRFSIIDVADPTNPRLIGSLQPPGHANDVVVSGTHAYLIGGTFYSVDISDPQHPILVGSTPADDGREAVVFGDYVLTVSMSSFAGFQSIDIADPEHPVVVGQTLTGGSGLGIALSNTCALVASGFDLHVVDVTNPIGAPLVAALPTPWPADLAIQGTNLYAAVGWDGFEVIDLADPRNPQISAILPLSGMTTTIAVAGPYAYAVGRYFDVIDIQSATPFVAASLSLWYPRDVALAGNYAYVTAGDSGVAVVDIADPLHPALLGYVPTFGWTYAIQVRGSHAYLLDEIRGLLIADISNPEDPQIVGALPAGSVMPDLRSSLAVSGDYLYVGRNVPGALHVVDVSHPRSPWIAGKVDLMYGVQAVTAVGALAYVANCGGLQIVDASDPARPRILGDAEIPWDATCVAVNEFQAYVGQSPGDEELRVLELQCEATSAATGWADPSGAPRVHICPTPTRGGATIRLAPPAEGGIAVWISDADGRLLRWLHAAPRAHEVYWDGRDNRGREVAPGLYFVRVVEAGEKSAGRVLIIR
jgi:YD repeat-containing protein